MATVERDTRTLLEMPAVEKLREEKQNDNDKLYYVADIENEVAMVEITLSNDDQIRIYLMMRKEKWYTAKDLNCDVALLERMVQNRAVVKKVSGMSGTTFNKDTNYLFKKIVPR